MPRKKIAEFSIDYLQVMDENGVVDKSLMPDISDAQIIEFYRYMVLGRVFDEKLFSLQRQGRIGTFPQAKGQEAANLGAIACLRKDDWLVPSYREYSGLLYRGVPLSRFILVFSGDERGNSHPETYRCLPYCIPIGSQLPHAAGIALGMKLKKERNVVLAFMGDGATSEGDFHESLNFAGVFKVPCVFVCQNNQYAISTPISKQTSSQTIAQKGIAYGIPSIKVDGNDIFAMFSATQEAVSRAREGNGPSLIEAFTYRLCDHTTSDDSKKYRSQEEIAQWEVKNPIARLRKFIESKKIWTEAQEEKLLEECSNRIESAVKEAEDMGIPPIGHMFEYMYKDMDQQLKEQFHYSKKFEGK